jgi:hypothetical protein
MGVFVGVEDVADPELSDGEDQPVGGAAAAELVGGAGDRLGRAAEIDRLAEERPLRAEIVTSMVSLRWLGVRLFGPA